MRGAPRYKENKMDALRSIFAAIFAEGTPEEHARAVRIAFRCLVAGYMVWGAGFLADLGLGGFARADALDSKVQAAVEPLRAEIGKIATQQAAQAEQFEASAELLRQIRADQLVSKIQGLRRLFCATRDASGRERLESEIEVAEQEYLTLTGGRYPLEACRP